MKTNIIMKDKTQNTLKSTALALLSLASMEMLIFYPEYISYVIGVSAVVLLIAIFIFVRVKIRSFASMMSAIIAFLFFASSMLSLVFIHGTTYKQLFIGASTILFFILMKRLMGLKVYEIQTMAYKQQYSYIDFILLLTSLYFYSGFFGLYLYMSLPLWSLLLAVFLVNGLLFFLFFYFNDLWLKKMWMYVFVLTFIVLEIAWTLSYWPNGLLGRGFVLFFIYYLLSGLGKHYLKETFSRKVVQEYVVVGIVVLALVLSTSQWTY
ncbi:hypothetical protein KKH43_00560 [Patescibacteria group bacterium]|nr:hypothetical protein [Patescibacteria group bacterium]